MTLRKKLLIVGGGFGGITLAQSLKNADLDILIIDRENHHLFQPLLYQVATATLSAADIAVPLREMFKNHKNISVIMSEVTSIDKVNNHVILSNQEKVEFDYLVLAVGAKHSYFGKTEWESFAPGLKTLKDALSIRDNLLLSFEKAERLENPEEIKKVLNFVIVGGGPTGVEMAGAIAEFANTTLSKNFRHIDPKNAKIYLLEGLPRILPVYSEKLSARAKKDLEKLGVEVINNKMVTAITQEGVQVGDLFIPSTNVIWAAGNQASPLLKTLDVPLDRQGRALVGPDLSIQNFSHIFVIGDAACAMDKDQKPLPGIAPVAMQEACYLAKILKNHFPAEQRPPFKYFDKGTMATIGKGKAVASSFGFDFGGILAWLAWCFLHIFYLIGFKNRISVMLQWIFHYLTGSRGARIIYRHIDQEMFNHKRNNQ